MEDKDYMKSEDKVQDIAWQIFKSALVQLPPLQPTQLISLTYCFIDFSSFGFVALGSTRFVNISLIVFLLWLTFEVFNVAIPPPAS